MLIEVNEFLTNYWQAVDDKNKEEFLTFFHADAMIYLHDSNAQFPPEFYIDDEHGDGWSSTIDRIEKLTNGQVITTTFHRSPNWVGFVNSFFTFKDEKIIELHEYFSPCDDNIVPQWREDLKDEERV